MIEQTIYRIWQVFALLAIQVLVCNHIHVMGYAMPLIPVCLLLYFRLNSGRIGNMLWAFVLGLQVDVFSGTPGLCSASMTLGAMVQYPLLQLMAPRDALEDMAPTYRNMGTSTHIRYAGILVAAHHLTYFVLESFSFHHIRDILFSALGSYLITMVLVLSAEVFRNKRDK